MLPAAACLAIAWAMSCNGLHNEHAFRMKDIGSDSKDAIWNGVLGRGCDEVEISEEKRLFTEWLPGIQ